MLVIVGGTSAVVFVIGEVIRFITEGEILKVLGELKKSRQVEGVSQHAIICGYGRIGQILAHDLLHLWISVCRRRHGRRASGHGRRGWLPII